MMIHRLKIIRTIKAIALTTFVMLPFQNCGNGFHLDEASISSSKYGGNSNASHDNDQNNNNGGDNPSADNTPPEITIISPLGNTYVKNSVVINGSCEAGRDITLTINGGSRMTLPCAAGTFASTVALSVADGDIILNLTQTDAAGNLGAKSVTVRKDTTNPVVTIGSPAQNAVLTAQSLTVSGTCEAGRPVLISGTLLSASAQTTCSNALTYSLVVSAVATNGSYVLTAEQTDAAGNKGTVSRNVSMNIPVGAPSIAISSPAANSATRTGITLAGTCTPGISVVISGTGVSAQSTTSCTSGNFSSAISFSSGDGVKNVIVSQTNSSNVRGEASRSFNLDTTAPAVAIASPAAGTQAESSLLIAGSCETGLTVSVGGSGISATSVPCSNSMFQVTVNFTANAGSKAVTVSQTDALGNVGTNSRSFERIQVLTTVRAILDAKCVSCHQAGGQAAFSPFTITTDQQFITAGLVTAGDPSRSKLIYRLKNYPDTSVTNRNMPSNGTLTASEYSILYNWVANMSAVEVLPFACNANDSTATKSVARSMKRLTQRQYGNTLVDLLSRGMSATNATTLVNTTLGNVTLLKDDATTFSRYDSGVVAQHMRAYFDVADAIATSVGSSANYSSFVTNYVNLNVGSCSGLNTSSLSTACVNQFITNFGLRALRRPVNTAEMDLYRAAYTAAGSNAAGINAVVFKFLLAPNFLYRIENEGTVVSGNLLRMSSYEIASRLSYMFWNSMPDEGLLTRAASDLSADAAFASALTYVTDSAKSQDSIKEFMDEWLHLSKTPQFATNNPILNYLADGLTLNASLRTAMVNEVQELGAYVFTNNQKFMDLFTSDISFARDSRLVSIYGVSGAAPANVTSSNAIRFPAGQRSGILSRAALLVGGTELANPIKRGVHIRKDILCLKLDNPPADASLAPPPIDVNRSTRERYDLATSASSCVGCHQYINTLGHAFGSYNSYGKYGTSEPIFDSSGTFTGRYLPISTQVDLTTSIGPGLSASGPGELSVIVANQNSTLKCFSEKALRFAEGRDENAAKEGCRLNSLYTKLKQAQSLKDFFKSVAQDPEFRHRLTQ